MGDIVGEIEGITPHNCCLRYSWMKVELKNHVLGGDIGYRDGIDDGVRVGTFEGLYVDITLGNDVGDVLGKNVGYVVGCADGIFVGCIGCKVGCAVGDTLGVDDGYRDGTEDEENSVIRMNISISLSEHEHRVFSVQIHTPFPWSRPSLLIPPIIIA